MSHDFLGDFLGSGYTTEQLDVLLASTLKPGDLETARGLHETKWWDYRFVHPGTGFFLYAHEYGQAVNRWRSMFGVNPDAVLSANDHPILRSERIVRSNSTTLTGKKLLSPPIYRTSMWRGMCFADSHGVPYDRWIGLAFEGAFEQKWERLPQPSNLYGDSIARYITDRWEREQADLLRLPVDPRYLPANDQGHRWQTAQYKWLVDLIAKRPLPHIPLAQYAFREQRLPLDLVREKFSGDILHRAMASARNR